MEYWQALVLGVVQGLTEFLPISSSGHLVLLRDLFGLDIVGGLAFDTVLHGATGLAVLIYFWKDLISLNLYRWKTIIIGIIPALLFAFFLEGFIENVFRHSWLVALALILGSLIMIVGEKRIKIQEDREPNIKEALYIGLIQVLSLIPGFSRSAMSMSGGMIVGLSRFESARFSFLMLLPISILAAGKQSLDLFNQGISLGTDFNLLLIGFISAFVFGILTIHLLLGFVRKNSFYPFIVYRVIIAILVLMFLV